MRLYSTPEGLSKNLMHARSQIWIEITINRREDYLQKKSYTNLDTVLDHAHDTLTICKVDSSHNLYLRAIIFS